MDKEWKLWCRFYFTYSWLDIIGTCNYWSIAVSALVEIIKVVFILERVYIEFCIKWNYYPEFDRVSKILKKKFPEVELIENQDPPRTGSFEVIIGERLVFSKFKLNRFPFRQEINGWDL